MQTGEDRGQRKARNFGRILKLVDDICGDGVSPHVHWMASCPGLGLESTTERESVFAKAVPRLAARPHRVFVFVNGLAAKQSHFELAPNCGERRSSYAKHRSRIAAFA